MIYTNSHTYICAYVYSMYVNMDYVTQKPILSKLDQTVAPLCVNVRLSSLYLMKQIVDFFFFFLFFFIS